MPGTFLNSMMSPQPPPTAPKPGSAKITIQNWQSAPREVQAADQRELNYVNHVRCSSLDSVDSNVSTGSSSGSGVNHSRQMLIDGEFIPTRTVTKTPSIPSHNPMQFVKVQSPLYRKAEQQIRLVKEVKISKDTLKETEEEWQSNLDNWKSRRRKVSEKVIKRAEEMKQIEQAEQLRQHKDQQRKIKTFSEIIEKRSSQRGYHLDFYVGGNDSGVGATPEPDEQECSLTIHQTNIKSDTSEGMTSETDSLDSDAQSSEKIIKEPPKVPKKPHSWLTRQASTEAVICAPFLANDLHHSVAHKTNLTENVSSAELSDVEAPIVDAETSEDDAAFSCPILNVDSGLESLGSHYRLNDTTDSSSDLSQDSCSGMDKRCHDVGDGAVNSNQLDSLQEPKMKSVEIATDLENEGTQLFIKIATLQICDSKELGFSLSSNKDDISNAVIENIIPDSPADLAGLKNGDRILSINNKSTLGCTSSSFEYLLKQAANVELCIYRLGTQGSVENKQRLSKRGVSFAQKLALFGGQISPTNGISIISETPKESASIEEELQRKSLVFKRLSAFEKNFVEADKFTNRRSSCVSSNSTNGWKNSDNERRLSLDGTKTADIISQTAKKKPPPIPSKPKTKSKLHKQDTISDIERKTELPSVENSNSASVSIIDEVLEVHQHSHGLNHDLNNINHDLNNTNHDLNNTNHDLNNTNHDLNNTNHDLNNTNHDFNNTNYDLGNTSHASVHSCNEVITENSAQLQGISDSLENQTDLAENSVQLQGVSDDLEKQTDLVTFEQNSSVVTSSFDLKQGEIVCCSPPMTDDMHNDVHNEIGSQIWNFHTTIDESISPENDVDNINNIFLVHSMLNPVNDEDDDNARICSESPDPIPNRPLIADAKTLDAEQQNAKTNYKSVIYIKDTASDISIVDSDHTDVLSTKEEEICIDDDCCSFKEVGEFPCQMSHQTINSDIIEVENKFENMEITDPSNEAHLEKINVSHHQSDLPTNRIEDEDASASTNSSSDSPDTETVIDNLPSNLSPLPTDEVVDTPSSNLLMQNNECGDFYSTCISEDLSIISEENSFDIPNPVLESQFISDASASNVYSSPTGSQDKELFGNELEESADTLSPLDVIDQIEMKLMQQLEQQALDDFTEICNSQLEEVNRQLLYLSDDGVLLEDLEAPSNMLPPSEPPPPPPETEKDSFQRANSTKRIKKEIWRRRSDFLGLDAPDEGINVDDLPPPPPALEELLKSEMEMQREQRLFLEKQLPMVASEHPSLNDHAVPYTETSYLPNDIECNSDYGLEVLDAEVFDAVDDQQNEDWVDNKDCQSVVPETHEYENVAVNEQKDFCKVVESPQHKAKSHIQTLGAAPRAKIVDSNKWITQTEHVSLVKQRSVDPIFQHEAYNQNFWLAQEASQKAIPSGIHTPLDRRYSMPPTYSSRQPDVTLRTWSDREVETHLQPRPKSMIWQGRSTSVAQSHSSYIPTDYCSNPNTCIETLNQDYEEDKNTLSVNHLCSCCSRALSEGSAMGIDTLQLYFHIECFKCCICQLQLGNGSCGTDVQVKNSQLYCPKCFFVE